MALGENTAFFNETTFTLGNEQTTDTAISGLNILPDGGGVSLSGTTPAKVLFNTREAILGETFHLGNVRDPERNLQFEFRFGSRYINQEIAVITANREAIQVTLHESLSTASASSSQTFNLSAKGFNSVGPTLRRLWVMGYV